MKVNTQAYQNYTKQDQAVWKLLFDRQIKNLSDKACNEYLECMEILKNVLHANSIVDFKKLDNKFKNLTGWSIKVVDGLIPRDEFFELLSLKQFPSSTWLRQNSVRLS